jgi:hypothetical protein
MQGAMNRAAGLALASLVGPLVLGLFLLGVRFATGDPAMPVYVALLTVLAGLALAVAAVIVATRTGRSRTFAWAALALNVVPVAVYAIGVIAWLNGDNS